MIDPRLAEAVDDIIQDQRGAFVAAFSDLKRFNSLPALSNYLCTLTSAIRDLYKSHDYVATEIGITTLFLVQMSLATALRERSHDNEPWSVTHNRLLTVFNERGQAALKFAENEVMEGRA